MCGFVGNLENIGSVSNINLSNLTVDTFDCTIPLETTFVTIPT